MLCIWYSSNKKALWVCRSLSWIRMLQILKRLPTITVDGKKWRDYSGFNTEAWPSQDLKVHRQKSDEYKNAKTQSDQASIAKEFGVRYSCLNELPYFEGIHFSVVDPMHKGLLNMSCMFGMIEEYWVTVILMLWKTLYHVLSLLMMLDKFHWRLGLPFLGFLQTNGKIGSQCFLQLL